MRVDVLRLDEPARLGDEHGVLAGLGAAADELDLASAHLDGVTPCRAFPPGARRARGAGARHPRAAPSSKARKGPWQSASTPIRIGRSSPPHPPQERGHSASDGRRTRRLARIGRHPDAAVADGDLARAPVDVDLGDDVARRGSIRVTVPSSSLATQTLPAPTATPAAPRPTGIAPTTRPSPGRAGATTSSSGPVTQTPPCRPRSSAVRTGGRRAQ